MNWQKASTPISMPPGNIIGFDIGRASGRLDLDSIEAFSLPIKDSKAA